MRVDDGVAEFGDESNVPRAISTAQNRGNDAIRRRGEMKDKSSDRLPALPTELREATCSLWAARRP